MNTIGRLFLFALFLSIFAHAEFAQEDEPASVSDNVMREVVQTILISEITPSDEIRTVALADTNVKVEWLPVIDGVNFVLVAGKELEGHAGYGFVSPTREEDHFVIEFGYWDRFGCSGGGSIWNFREVNGEVKVWQVPNNGWGSGCGSGSS